MVNRKQIAESILPGVVWQTESIGISECPGKHLHSKGSSKRDCRVYLEGAPTIFCFHQSCSGMLEDLNYKLRFEIGKVESGGEFKPMELNQAERAKIDNDMAAKRSIESIRENAPEWLNFIIENFKWDLNSIMDSSPVRIPKDQKDVWKLFTCLFSDDWPIWNGNVKDTGQPHHKTNFRIAGFWDKPLGNFTCASMFKEGSYSRSNENVVLTPFLVVESDELKRDQFLSLIQFLRGILRLRAVISTGGKSLHAWFDMPESGMLEMLKIILPSWKCDRAMFIPSQPVRLPGVVRENGVMQKLLWLDYNGLTDLK